MPQFPATPQTLLDSLAAAGAFDEVKWQHFDALYRPVVRAFLVQRFPSLASEADDFVQETMTRLVGALRTKRYDATRGRFRTFLATIVSNLAVDTIRRHTRFAALPLETIDWLSPEAAPAIDLIDRQWQEACYAAARHHVLHRVPLPPNYAIIWRALEKGESPAVLSTRLHITPALVRQAKHRVAALIAAQIKNLNA